MRSQFPKWVEDLYTAVAENKSESVQDNITAATSPATAVFLQQQPAVSANREETQPDKENGVAAVSIVIPQTYNPEPLKKFIAQHFTTKVGVTGIFLQKWKMVRLQKNRSNRLSAS